MMFLGFGVFSLHLVCAVIQSGSIDITPSPLVGPALVAGTFTLSEGPLITATGSFADDNWGPAHCDPCSPGDSLTVSATEAGSDFLKGTATIGDPTFFVNWGDPFATGGSEFDIAGPAVTVTGPGTYTSTFSSAGFLCGTTKSGGPVDP